MSVVALPEVRLYLKDLVRTLYEKEYFGLEESALKYVEELFDDIETNLSRAQRRKAPVLNGFPA